MRYLIALSILAVRLSAQPGACWVGLGADATSGGCPCITTGAGAQSPCVQSYIAQINSTLAANTATLAPLAKNVIPNGLQLVGAEANYIENDTAGCWNTNTCVFANLAYEEAFISNIVAKSGATYLDWNIDLLPFIQDSFYTGSACTTVETTATCSRMSALLSFYNSIFAYLGSHTFNGALLKIRLAPISYGPIWASCSISSPSTMAVATMDACLDPYYSAMVQRIVADLVAAGSSAAQLADVTALHEPLEAFGLFSGKTGVNAIVTSDWNTAIGSICTAIYTVEPTVNCGSGFSIADSAYVTALASSVPAHTNFGGIDFYYTGTLSSWTAQGNTYATWCQEFVTAGLVCKLNESGVWGHCSDSSGVGCNSALYEGCGWLGLEQYGVNDAFNAWLSRWVSAMGGTYVTTFYDQQFAMFQSAPVATTACTDNSLTGYTAAMLQNVGTAPTTAGLGWKFANTWPNISVFGRVATTGKVRMR